MRGRSHPGSSPGIAGGVGVLGRLAQGLWSTVVGLLCCLVLGLGLGAGAVEPTAIVADGAIASDKVLQFANAYQQVLQIIDRQYVEIQSAETDYIAARRIRDLEGEALGVIQAAGLSWSEYLQMLNLANLDSEFGEEVAWVLQELDAAPRSAPLPHAATPPVKPLGSKIN
jgi:Domain of unknown function (DUF4168)